MRCHDALLQHFIDLRREICRNISHWASFSYRVKALLCLLTLCSKTLSSSQVLTRQILLTTTCLFLRLQKAPFLIDLAYLTNLNLTEKLCICTRIWWQAIVIARKNLRRLLISLESHKVIRPSLIFRSVVKTFADLITIVSACLKSCPWCFSLSFQLRYEISLVFKLTYVDLVEALYIYVAHAARAHRVIIENL